MKLWEKGTKTNKGVESFTVGNDRIWDLELAESDIMGSMAHSIMLGKIGYLTLEEVESLRVVFLELLEEVEKGIFIIDPSMEDIHSQIEYRLTLKLGDVGRKIHTGRSRNDQILLDLKLLYRKELLAISQELMQLFQVFISSSETYKEELLPGYTHFQVAMPSSFGLWFGGYAEALGNDLESLFTALKLINRNPLGSGAGYGTALPLDRELTTRLLGFEDLDINSTYAQMSRGKSEMALAQALAEISMSLNKFATDVCLYTNQDFGFITLPDAYTTGSSIMPHKKNPDVFELIRGKTNLLMSLQGQISQMQSNLPSGYHRDFQLTKELIFPALKEIHSILNILIECVPQIIIGRNLLVPEKYKLIFSVDRVHEKVAMGTPFRIAYQEVAAEIQRGEFNAPAQSAHVHLGSMGNLGNKQIQSRTSLTYSKFPFSPISQALYQLFLPLKSLKTL